jgi:hypothetical protein
MAYSNWVFMKPNDGRPLERVPRKFFDEMGFGGASSPYVHADGSLYVAIVTVSIAARRPFFLSRQKWMKRTLRADGRTDWGSSWSPTRADRAAITTEFEKRRSPGGHRKSR